MTFLKMKKTDGSSGQQESGAALVESKPVKKNRRINNDPPQKPRLGAPPDGGWGWVVALSSFSISLLVDGVCFSFGIFFDDFRTEFKTTKAATSWIGSTLNGSYLIFGPIVSALVNIYGCRPVAMCGAVLASIAFFCSSYTHHIGTLIFTFGFLGGIGFGLMYLPAIVIVGYYFERRRALATGIACCGSGIGAFLFAPFSEYLLNEYGWRGATWIISGLVLNGFMFALFYRPLPGPTMEQIIPEGPNQSDTEFMVTEDETGLVSEVNDPLLLSEVTDVSLNESTSLSYKAENGRVPMSSRKQQQQQQQHRLQNQLHLGQRTTSSSSTPRAIDNDTLNRIRQDLLGPSDTAGVYRTSSVILPGLDKVSHQQNVVRMTRSHDFFLSGDKMADSRKPETIRLPHLQRKDIFYSGSIAHLKEYQELGSLDRFRDEMISPATGSLEDTRGQGRDPRTVTTSVSRPTMKEAMKSIFDFELLKSPTFLVYGLSCFLCMAGFFVPFTYMPDHAIGLGWDTRSAAFLISIIGITNTVGRVAVGFISDQPWADCLLINNVALMIGGAVTVFVPYYTHYSVLAIYSAVFGSAIAVFVSLRSIIMVELMGLEKLTTAFGFVIMFQGLSSLLGSPIAGALSDATGNYNAAFYMAGITLFLSGVMCVPLKRVARWETRRIEARKEEERKMREQKRRASVEEKNRRRSSNYDTSINNNVDNDNNDDNTDDHRGADGTDNLQHTSSSTPQAQAVPEIKIDEYN